MRKFSERLKELRNENGLSQVEVGKKLGVTQSTIAKWESNEREPAQEMLVEIAKFFNISTDYLLGLSD